MAPEGETSVVVEAPCFSGDAIERLAPEELVALASSASSAALRLLDPRDVVESRHHFIPNAYPVYTSGYAGTSPRSSTALARIENLETLGRAGRFVYSHLHDQLRFGKDYVRSLAEASRAHSA